MNALRSSTFAASVALIASYIASTVSQCWYPALAADTAMTPDCEGLIIVVTKKSDAEKHSPAELWALACPAILAVVNGGRHDTLAEKPHTAELEKRCKDGLARWWRVGSRDDLLKQLEWIQNGGHRNRFQQLTEILEDQASISEVEQMLAAQPQGLARFRAQMQLLRNLSPTQRKKSIYGWDYCRYIGLCRWGYEAGYIRKEEAWAKIMPAAELLQSRFSSWKDLGENYLIGREFWMVDAKNQDRFEQAAVSLLATDPKSPWKLLKWDTRLKSDANLKNK